MQALIIAAILMWSCDEAFGVGIFDLNTPKAERNNGGKRAGDNIGMLRSGIPDSVGSNLKQRPKNQKIAEPVILHTPVMGQGTILDALEIDLPGCLRNSLAIG